MMPPKRRLWRTLLLAAASSALLSGCGLLAPRYERPPSPVPASWSQGQSDANAPSAAQTGWQQYFVDARLQRLIALALAHNRDLRIATLNVQAAQAQYGIARADRAPTLTVAGGGTRARTSADASPTGQSFISEMFNAGVGITGFELDLFGRVHNTSNAAWNGFMAAQYGRDAAHISLIAAVAQAYVAQRSAQEALDIARKALAAREETGKLAQLRFDAGVLSAIDLRQNETLVAAAQADVAAHTRQREAARHALELLIGQSLPDDLPDGAPLADLIHPQALPAGATSDVLLRRPDIAQAEAQLRAANAHIGAARAAFFPRITLTGSYGSVSREVKDLFNAPNLAWSFAPQLVLPIFDWGRNLANLDLAHTRKHMAVAQYEKAIQTAFREVADALSARSTLAAQYTAMQRGNQAENERLRLVQMRHDNGIASSLELLDAQRQSYASALALLQVRQQMLVNRIDLYKVLGGGLLEGPAHAVAP